MLISLKSILNYAKKKSIKRIALFKNALNYASIICSTVSLNSILNDDDDENDDALKVIIIN
jgi:hypothetical protein